MPLHDAPIPVSSRRLSTASETGLPCVGASSGLPGALPATVSRSLADDAQGPRLGRDRVLRRVPSYCEGRDVPLHGVPIPLSSRRLSAVPESGLPCVGASSGLPGAWPATVSRPLADESVATSAGQSSTPGPLGLPACVPVCAPSALGSPVAQAAGRRVLSPRPSVAAPTEAELHQFFTPALVDPSKCVARLVREGVAKQCSSRPVSGALVCISHKPKKGRRNAAGHTSKYGLLSGPLPGEVLPELASIWQASRCPQPAQSSG